MPLTIEIAILAGGESTRMGQDKSALIWEGRTVLEHLVSKAIGTTLPVAVIGRSIPQERSNTNLRSLPDVIPRIGPLGGLYTALTTTTADAVLALACDTPLLTTAAINWLILQAKHMGDESDGIVVRNGDHFEPLFAIYKLTCLPLIQKQMDRGNRALYKLITSANFATVDAPSDVGLLLANFNTPEDWAAFTGSPEINP